MISKFCYTGLVKVCTVFIMFRCFVIDKVSQSPVMLSCYCFQFASSVLANQRLYFTYGPYQQYTPFCPCRLTLVAWPLITWFTCLLVTLKLQIWGQKISVPLLGSSSNFKHISSLFGRVEKSFIDSGVSK